MRIGIDLRPLQGGDKVRGIGEVARRVTAEIAKNKKKDDQLILYMYEGMETVDTRDFGDDIEIQLLPQPKRARLAKVFPFLQSRVNTIIRQTSDVFVQYNFKMGLPKGHKSILLVHDQIPLQFGNKYPYSYLATYKVARRAGLSRKHALLDKALRRRVYIRDLQTAIDRASEVLAVSTSAARDTEAFARRNIQVTPALLGFTQPKSEKADALLNLEKARLSALGVKKGNFLFFIGGVDDRRRIDELVWAFNSLRATGHDLKLVFAGYDFNPDLSGIFSPAARRAIETSSYREDICLLGFISNRERAWLYENAKAFVFPTEYEGFGLPILESLAEGCPVITYNNSATPEVAGPNVLMVEGWKGIVDAVEKLDGRSSKEASKLAEEGKEWTKKFTWTKTAKVFMRAIADAAK